MPKVEIDYSNTIFYKIFCKDTTIKDLYVGLTTNFVQRKHAHKQSCKNEKALNHNCKLYNAIRNAGGWDNWQMEIIAFHNCADSYEARKKEQEYFEALGATLNSIDPFPKPKIKEPLVKIAKKKKILFCEPCNVQFAHWKTQETHNNTKKHHKMVAAHIPNMAESNKATEPPNCYVCAQCDYKCCLSQHLKQHFISQRHKKRVGNNVVNSVNNTEKNVFTCDCGKEYTERTGLWKHKTKGKCVKQPCNNPDDPQSTKTEHTKLIDDDIISVLIHQCKELSDKNKELIWIIKNGMHNYNEQHKLS